MTEPQRQNPLDIGVLCVWQTEPPTHYEVLEALRLTVEYVGIETLRPLPGWSWFDVLSRCPEYADWLDSMVNPKPVEIDPNALVSPPPLPEEG